jgi:hypothetical protein
MVRWLLQQGADRTIVNNAGETARSLLGITLIFTRRLFDNERVETLLLGMHEKGGIYNAIGSRRSEAREEAKRPDMI